MEDLSISVAAEAVIGFQIVNLFLNLDGMIIKKVLLEEKKEKMDVVLLMSREMTADLLLDLEEMKIEVLLVKKETTEGVLLDTEEMIADLHLDLEETKTKVLLGTEEMIADLLRNLKEVIAKVLLEKKIVQHLKNLLDLKRNLVVLKKNRLKNFQRDPNLNFRPSLFFSYYSRVLLTKMFDL